MKTRFYVTIEKAMDCEGRESTQIEKAYFENVNDAINEVKALAKENYSFPYEKEFTIVKKTIDEETFTFIEETMADFDYTYIECLEKRLNNAERHLEEEKAILMKKKTENTIAKQEKVIAKFEEVKKEIMERIAKQEKKIEEEFNKVMK